eukprot:scaffold2331_cov252-Pinguiococcus_pyrenoidosus.AAC.12
MMHKASQALLLFKEAWCLACTVKRQHRSKTSFLCVINLLITHGSSSCVTYSSVWPAFLSTTTLVDTATGEARMHARIWLLPRCLWAKAGVPPQRRLLRFK